MGSMGSMTEGILLSLLFVVLLGVVLSNLNDTYDKDFSIGLETDSLDEFTSLIEDSEGQVTEGEVVESSSDSGLSLKTSWALAKGIFGTLWDFISGQWITNLIQNILKVPGSAGIATALVLRLLFLSTLIWAILKLFFKVTI
jgi:hypothetical protein